MSGLGKYLEVPVIIDFHEVRDAFTRNVMILIAATALASGVVEFLNSRAAVEGERTGIEAQQLGARAMTALVRADQMAQTELEQLELEQEQRTRRTNAELAVLFRQMNPSVEVGGTEALDLEVKRLQELIGRTAQLWEIDPEFRPERDPTFPDRFFGSKQRDYWKQWARQDAANEEYGGWKRQQSWYTTVLSGYAAALYLFGLSLAIQLPVREKLAGVAVALVLAASGVAGWTAMRVPRQAPEEAAEAYAGGKQALGVAHDKAGYATAKTFLSRAIEVRRTFAQAYQDRGDASFRIGSPQRMGAPGVTDLGALREAVRDEEEALRLGWLNRSLLFDHGNDLFLLALEDDKSSAKERKARLEKSIAVTKGAIDLDPQYPELHYNLAVTYLANRQFKDAHDAFATAVGLTLAKEKKRYRYSRWNQEQFVASALTDLASVFRARARVGGSGQSQEALVCEIRALKEYIVGSVSMRKVLMPPPPGKCPAAAPASDGHFEVFPISLRWYDGLNGFHADDVLSVQWYHQDPGLKKWVALPDVSVLDTPSVSKSQRFPGQSYHAISYITRTTPPSCVQAGEYRAELYVNGRLVNPERKPESADFADVNAVMPRDLNAAFCVPANWDPWPEQSEPGFIIGYRSHERTPTKGMLLVRFPYPRPWISDQVAREQTVVRYLEYTLKNRLNLVPGGSLSVPSGFVGLQILKVRGFTAGSISIVTQSGVSSDGAIVIGLVYGPTTYIEKNREAIDIFNSIVVFGPHGPDYF